MGSEDLQRFDNNSAPSGLFIIKQTTEKSTVKYKQTLVRICSVKGYAARRSRRVHYKLYCHCNSIQLLVIILLNVSGEHSFLCYPEHNPVFLVVVITVCTSSLYRFYSADYQRKEYSQRQHVFSTEMVSYSLLSFTTFTCLMHFYPVVSNNAGVYSEFHRTQIEE